MKKILSLFISMIVISVISLPCFADSETHDIRLVDNANLLTASEKETVLEALDSISEKNRFEVVVVTTNSTDGKTAEAYADDFYDYNNYGYGENHDGALLLVDMSDRYIHISGCGSGEKIINSKAIDKILDYIIDDLGDGNYARAFTKFANRCEKYVKDAENGIYESSLSSSSDTSIINPMAIIIGVIFGIICGFIGVSNLKSQLKSVKKNDLAFAYTSNDKFRLTNSQDIFLYSNVSKVRIEHNSSGGHSGGRSGGSHISSSGRSHSGGGRHF